jgi:hypothetical protein
VPFFFLFFFLGELFLWRFCAFLNKGSSKTPKKMFGEKPSQKLLAEKVKKKKAFFLLSSHRFFLSRFWPFSCMRSPKIPLKYFLKSDLKVSKNLKKSRQVGTSFFFFLWRPLPLAPPSTALFTTYNRAAWVCKLGAKY